MHVALAAQTPLKLSPALARCADTHLEFHVATEDIQRDRLFSANLLLKWNAIPHWESALEKQGISSQAHRGSIRMKACLNHDCLTNKYLH